MNTVDEVMSLARIAAASPYSEAPENWGALETRLRELLEGDPVAWVTKEMADIRTRRNSFDAGAHRVNRDDIPLYAAPRPVDVDKISDERIDEIVSAYESELRDNDSMYGPTNADGRDAMRAAIKAALGGAK